MNAVLYQQPDVVSFLLSCGANPSLKSPSNQTALKLACEKENLEIISLLLGSSLLNLNQRDSQGKTILHFACSFGNKAIIEMVFFFKKKKTKQKKKKIFKC